MTFLLILTITKIMPKPFFGRWCIYEPFIKLSKGVSNRKNIYLRFIQGKHGFKENSFKRILTTFMLASLMNLYIFGT